MERNKQLEYGRGREKIYFLLAWYQLFQWFWDPTIAFFPQSKVVQISLFSHPVHQTFPR